MRFADIDLYEGYLFEARVGRELQHLEDLVFVDGSTGAHKAVNYLRDVAGGRAQPMVKWDGSIALYFGRNAQGQFGLMHKNAWTKGDWIGSARELRDYIANSGRGEEWRASLAASLAGMWDVLERATPRNARYFLFGDLLFNQANPPQKADGRLEFTPNKVTYSADLDSPIGKKIARAKVGIAVHRQVDEFGSSNLQPIESLEAFSSPEVFLVGETYIPHQPEIDSSKLDQLEQHVNQYADEVDGFLEPVPGLKSIASIIYKFSNQMARGDGHSDMERKFYEWIKENVSKGQQEKIRLKQESYPLGSEWLFRLFEEIAAVKNDVIDQLDNAEQDLIARTGDQKGGEGYADPRQGIKLVPRSRWVAG